MLVPNRAGYTRVKDSSSQPGVTRTFQQYIELLPVDCYRYSAVNVAASDDRDENTIKQHI